MRVRTVRRRGAASAALLTCALLATAPAQAAVPPAADARTQASASPAGEWWFDLLGVGDAHRVTRGAGAVVALVDSPLHPDAAELQRPNVSVVRTYCDDGVTTERAANSFHGTSMAAMIAGDGRAARPGTPGLRGLAPDATLRVYVADDTFRPDEFECFDRKADKGTFDLVSQAIRDAADEGAHIINLSVAMGGLADAVAYAVSKGVVVVASANSPGESIGADTGVGLPAGHPGVVAVSAVGEDRRVWDGSVPGGVHVSAPGVEVRSGQVTADGGWDPDAVNTGTSPATAYVSGVLALVKSRYPAATGPQLVQHLLRNTADEGAVKWDRFSGFGVPSLSRLLGSDPTRQPDHFPFLEVPVETMSAQERQAALDRPFAIFGTPTPSPVASPSVAPVPSSAPTPVAAPRADDGGSSPAVPIGLGAVALLGLGAGALVLRRRTPSPTSSPAPPATEGL